MKFNDDVISLEFNGIPMIGNLRNGHAIGLTSQGANVCRRLLEDDVLPDEISAVDSALLDHLSKGGFFESEGDVATLQDGADSRQSPSASQVLSAYLHVTQRCNLQCRGCYSLDDNRNTLLDAPLGDICHAVDQLADAGVQRIVISGGEPFLRSDLPEIVKHAKKAGVPRVDVLSNGTCITDEVLAEMSPYVDGVSISFDGFSQECVPHIRLEQRFDELCDAVRRINQAGIPAHIIPTAHAKNIADLPRYMELAQKLGATMNFSLLTCEPGDPELGELLPDDEALRLLGRSLLTMGSGGPVLAMDAPIGMNLTVKRGCGAGTKSLSIDADGTIYPCHMMHRPELAMGNAFTGTLEEALAGDVAHNMGALCVEDCDECGECRYMYICGGGCRARSLYSTGSLRQRDSYCAMIKEFYDLLGANMVASMQRSS